MRRKLVVGNWKMHGTRAENASRLTALKQNLAVMDALDIAVCPPSIYLPQVADSLSGTAIRWGAQNVSEHAEGAFTGEVSAAMLADWAVHYGIIGHSERRQLFGETDDQVAAKFVALQRAGITPVLCVGETLEERRAGKALATVGRQVQRVIDRAGMQAFAAAVIAYEPVWAIGTGETASPAQAQEVHAAIRQLFAVEPELAEDLAVLYGGSVKPDNAAALFAEPDIDGALVGGAALDPEQFTAICRAALTV